ncbi:hypothetical protein CES86_5025 [Brucella lupini]|uniref:Uncharacterized protein n=1 Tax=Brucella lupini TaxID=255457 RepID=A0A256GC81_9HYPH|nr:hypothetical protein CES86_5025 [Brucella lupini]
MGAASAPITLTNSPIFQYKSMTAFAVHDGNGVLPKLPAIG